MKRRTIPLLAVRWLCDCRADHDSKALMHDRGCASLGNVEHDGRSTAELLDATDDGHKLAS